MQWYITSFFHCANCQLYAKRPKGLGCIKNSISHTIVFIVASGKLTQLQIMTQECAMNILFVFLKCMVFNFLYGFHIQQQLWEQVIQ